MSNHKSQRRTYVLKPESISFLDGFSQTYGISRSATLNLIVRDFQNTLDSIDRDNPANGAKVAMAIAMQAEQLNS